MGGCLLPYQEGRLHQEASGEKQEGQRRQVQADSCREQNPQIGQVLQDQGCSATNFQVREFHRLHPGGLSLHLHILGATLLVTKTATSVIISLLQFRYFYVSLSDLI